MNKRSREILSQLITKTEYSQTISIQELADMFKVSSRTIRYDIQPVNLGKRGGSTPNQISRKRENPSQKKDFTLSNLQGKKESVSQQC